MALFVDDCDVVDPIPSQLSWEEASNFLEVRLVLFRLRMQEEEQRLIAAIEERRRKEEALRREAKERRQRILERMRERTREISPIQPIIVVVRHHNHHRRPRVMGMGRFHRV